ncbi:unnamed protein product [Nippostrongylus brasiliensis]|uniref:TLC domain-containing protein n=1 Tax=Nippostrongylus brasiliensis TaxID=27835 RepID=A0A0N4YEM1_NIPBR|nr:unnamed protein product [Nippostrongylus brasiliensis]
MGLVTVRDEWTKLVGHRFLNSQLCLWIGLVQAIVCMWGVAQHCHSVIHYRKILHCDFLDGSMPLEAADAVIFDIGLFHSLWGIRGCVAEYLDGGFGRLAWCVSHIISLAVSLPFAFVSRPRPCFLWPLLIQVCTLLRVNIYPGQRRLVRQLRVVFRRGKNEFFAVVAILLIHL